MGSIRGVLSRGATVEKEAGGLYISILVSRDAPAIRAEVQGGDGDVVDGIRHRLAGAFQQAKPRIPAAPAQVMLLVVYFVTFMYGFGLATLGLLDWLPENVLGGILYFVLVLGSAFGLGTFIYWLVNRVLLRPLELRTAEGKAMGLQPKRVLAAFGGFVLAIFPIVQFLIEQLSD